MKAFITLLFMMFIIILNGNYSIDSFINYLQESGYYDILVEIKYSLGDDVAIALCQELVIQTNDCEYIIRVYMAPKYGGANPNIDSKIEDPNTDTQQIIDPKDISEDLIKFEKELDNLLKKYGPNFEIIKDIFLKYYGTLIKEKEMKQLLIIAIKLYNLYLTKVIEPGVLS